MIRFHINCYDCVGSTNDEACRLAEAGAPHGTVVVAREQVAGRGRRGRHWRSPPGNLYLSIVLRLDLPVTRIAELSFVAALAVADTVDWFVPAGQSRGSVSVFGAIGLVFGKAVLKWPNDVLVNGAKISGILLEHVQVDAKRSTAPPPAPSRKGRGNNLGVDDAVVVGIGVNVLHVPENASSAATSLLQAGGWRVADMAEPHAWVAKVQATLLGAFADRLAAWQDGGFGPVRNAWLLRAHPLGTELRVAVGNSSITGKFAGLACDGELLLDAGDNIRRITAGDVALVSYPNSR